MKKLFLCLALLLVITGSLQANLGETEALIMGRYGKELGASTSTTNRDISRYFLYKDTFIVTVTMIDHQSEREAYSAKDEDPAQHENAQPKRGRNLSSSEVKMLLDANTLGSKWTLTTENENYKNWVLDSKAAIASYDTHQHILTLETQTMVGFDRALKTLGEKKGD